MEQPHLLQNLPHTVKQPLSAMFCGKGFNITSAEEAAHGNTSTTPRLAHKLEKPKKTPNLYLLVLDSVFCAVLTRQNQTSPTIRKIHPRSFPEKSCQENLRINLHNSCFNSLFKYISKRRRRKKDHQSAR